MARTRANGEGSIFPYRHGYAAYVWVNQPDGTRRRKWACGKTTRAALKRLSDALGSSDATPPDDAD